MLDRRTVIAGYWRFEGSADVKGIAPIRNDVDHSLAVVEIRRLWGAEPGTVADERLDALMVQVDAYEAKYHAID